MYSVSRSPLPLKTQKGTHSHKLPSPHQVYRLAREADTKRPVTGEDRGTAVPIGRLRTVFLILSFYNIYNINNIAFTMKRMNREKKVVTQVDDRLISKEQVGGSQ